MHRCRCNCSKERAILVQDAQENDWAVALSLVWQCSAVQCRVHCSLLWLSCLPAWPAPGWSLPYLRPANLPTLGLPSHDHRPLRKHGNHGRAGDKMQSADTTVHPSGTLTSSKLPLVPGDPSCDW